MDVCGDRRGDARPAELVTDAGASSREAVADERPAQAVKVGGRDLIVADERPGDPLIVPDRLDLELVNGEELAADGPIRELGGVDVHIVLAWVGHDGVGQGWVKVDAAAGQVDRSRHPLGPANSSCTTGPTWAGRPMWMWRRSAQRCRTS